MSRFTRNHPEVGQSVTIGPNLRSLHVPDHSEPVWKGRIIYITQHSIGVEPVDPTKLPRDVLRERIQND